MSFGSQHHPIESGVELTTAMTNAYVDYNNSSIALPALLIYNTLTVSA